MLKNNNRLTRHSWPSKHDGFGHVIGREKCHEFALTRRLKKKTQKNDEQKSRSK